MKKNTFLLIMLLMAFVATNNVFAQASIIGKWKFNKLELKPAAGKKFTSEQAKGIEAYKKAMLPRFTGAVWAFEESTYAITETSKQEPVETGNYTFVEEKNQLVMTRSGSNTSQKQPERRAKIKENQLIVEMITGAKDKSGIDKIVFTFDKE